MPSNNQQVKFRVSDTQAAEIEAAMKGGEFKSIGAYAKAATLATAREATKYGRNVREAVEPKPKLKPEVKVQDKMRGVCKTHGNMVVRHGRCAQVGCKG